MSVVITIGLPFDPHGYLVLAQAHLSLLWWELAFFEFPVGAYGKSPKKLLVNLKKHLNERRSGLLVVESPVW
jgi:hypothetical protein